MNSRFRTVVRVATGFLSAGWILHLAQGLAALMLLWAGFLYVRSRAVNEIYRSELSALASEYGGLLEQYNEAIRRTAVTELDVSDGRVYVRIRTEIGRAHV